MTPSSRRIYWTMVSSILWDRSARAIMPATLNREFEAQFGMPRSTATSITERLYRYGAAAAA
jgi:hypothetical protein